MLSPRTERDYRQVVERWTRDGQPDPAAWVAERSSEATRRNARAALVWHFRVNLGKTLDIPWVRPLTRPVPSAFSVEELAILRDEALSVHRRCRPVIDLLYSTGARLQEACGIALEDVTAGRYFCDVTDTKSATWTAEVMSRGQRAASKPVTVVYPTDFDDAPPPPLPDGEYQADWFIENGIRRNPLTSTTFRMPDILRE